MAIPQLLVHEKKDTVGVIVVEPHPADTEGLRARSGKLIALDSRWLANPVVESSLAILLRICPPMAVKSPPTTILPSACTTIE